MALVQQLGDDSWLVVRAAFWRMALVFTDMHAYNIFNLSLSLSLSLSLFVSLSSTCALLQLVGKRYLLKPVRTLERKKEEEEGDITGQTLHLAQRIESVPEKASRSQVASVWREWFYFSSSPFYFPSVWTSFNGYCVPLAIKGTRVQDLAHQRERVALCCSCIQFPFMGHYVSLYKHFKIQFDHYIYPFTDIVDLMNTAWHMRGIHKCIFYLWQN